MDILQHYGTPRHSGRYPWGSGDNPYQRTGHFLKTVQELKAQGMTERQIAESFGFSDSGELRARIAIASNNNRKADIAYALKLKEHGYSNTEIGRRMGINESTVRSLLSPSVQANAKLMDATIDKLRDSVNEKNYIDIGAGAEFQIGVSRDRLKKALVALQDEGYEVMDIYVTQQGTGKKTTMQILAKPGTTAKELYDNVDKIGVIENRVDPNSELGQQKMYFLPPKSIDSDRIQVRYAEEGGKDMDGVIELRRGVEDISLGDSQYAQVRIAVDGTHYLKGMAMYADDLPEGIDIRFNTNKHQGTPMIGDKDNSVLKPMKDDPNNPFGTTIKPIGEGGQRFYIDSNGKEQQSVINKVNDEGDWDTWSKNLASQMLSKQPVGLVRQQLTKTYQEREKEYNDILTVTNPVVKRKLLEQFADSCDGNAVDLKAAALPRQKAQVILPVTTLGDDEIYATNFRPGEKVVLIRYPHGGRFEIPELTVNNDNAQAKSTIGLATDAVGINARVAAKLSGADFDGDTVIVIPNNSGAIKTDKSNAYDALKDFDPKESYPLPDSAPRMTNKTKQLEMGKVSNLITDMTIKKADPSEIVRAVKHSMVVIDAEKHHLDYKKSYEDNGIAELKAKYQGGVNRGASTLISKASAEYDLNERKVGYVKDPNTGKQTSIDPETGKKIFTDTGREYTKSTLTTKDANGNNVTKTVYPNKNGNGYFYKVKGGKVEYLSDEDAAKVKTKTYKARTKSSWMSETDDAYELSSGTPVENAYASFANKMKALANSARKEQLATKDIPYSSSAKKTYEKEVASLTSKLNEALKNAPYERQAQRIAESVVKSKMRDNPDMTAEEIKKERGRQLVTARNRVGAGKKTIDISDKEWEAIQAGAVTPNTLKQIVNNSNMDKLKTLATPRSANAMTDSKAAVAKALASNGYSQSEIAERLGVSTSAVSKALKAG